MDIPVYLFAGFLDSGKSSFINDILEDGFATEGRTLLISCEEGEVAYDPRFLKNVDIVTVEDEEELDAAFFRSCEKKYKPTQIVFEFNGMWSIEALFSERLPANWVLYQIMTIVDASSFESFAKNMAPLMMEKIRNADMIVFNRCTDALKASLRARNLRMINRRAAIYLEDGNDSEDYLTGDECYFDLTQDTIAIPDEDFGLWYVDMMDHLERYDGKRLAFKAVMCHSKRFPGVHCPGRFAMVCCADDVQFLGVICKGDGLDAFANHDWVHITAVMRIEDCPAYEGNGPVLYVEKIEAAEKPAEETVTF